MHREELQEQRAHHRRPGEKLPYTKQQTASPHHAGTNAGMHPVDTPYTTDDVEAEEEEYDDVYPPRLNSSTRRYTGAATHAETRQSSYSPIPARQSRQPAQDLANLPRVVQIGGHLYRVQDHGTTAPPKRVSYAQPADRQTEEQVALLGPENQRQRTPHAPRRFHWLFWIGMVFSTMLVGWTVFTFLGSWVQLKDDDLLYGRPRTFQTDATVGHHDSPTNPSHFQCTNLNKQIQVIEFPGGNVSQAKMYVGPTLIGPGSELTVCTLSFQDVNGDGKPDMVLTIGKEIFVMINDGTGFRPVKAGEHLSL